MKQFQVPMPTDPKRAIWLKSALDQGRKIRGTIKSYKTIYGTQTVAMVEISVHNTKNPRKWLPMYAIAKVTKPCTADK